MALSGPATTAAIRKVEAFCAQRVPDEHRDQIRLEVGVRANTLTIVERRRPWSPEYGPEWTTNQIAQLRYHPENGTWSLHWRDRNERWFPYADTEPSSDVAPLLSEIDTDPTGIFWG